MADASDSKSDAGNSVWVQVPSPALTQKSRKHAIFIEKSRVYGSSSLRNICKINCKFVIKIQNLVRNLVIISFSSAFDSAIISDLLPDSFRIHLSPVPLQALSLILYCYHINSFV